ncbi:hypothetical protein EK21DRAFT_53898 [Setomelanomma holmii]|uniref:Rhodopsin domain-containing protein n=1 Tax=Setomelanomma holmii TaxID=210430 RepID=A0A9P4HJS7_9PLEO|nr:hypothetical protein EK21DRAFT_53898 [Setomelanomma holmii]
MRDFRPAILATNAVLIVLSLAAIACRVGRKTFLVGSFSWHDALITLAAISASTFSILQTVSTRFGVGLPNADVPDSNMTIILKLVMASRIFYFTCNWAVKHSLLLFYATLTIDHWPRISIYTMHFLAFAFGMTNIFATIFQCLPIHKMWNDKVPGHCINIDAFNYFNSCFMLANDLSLYAMPLLFTWKLHVSRPQRIAVNLLFALGGLVLAASGARIYFVYAQATYPDFTYRFALTMMCAVIENHLAIIVACAPSIKVMLLHTCPSLEKKFEKLVSNRSSGSEEFSIATIVMADAEAGWGMGRGKGEGGGLRPMSERTVTGDSGRSRSQRKWWRAPSSWEVDREGVESGDAASR